MGVILGDGWYRGNLGFSGQRNTYGDRLALLARFVITYADGSSQSGHERQLEGRDGPILASDIYNGETYDARLEKKGWSSPGYDDAAWSGGPDSPITPRTTWSPRPGRRCVGFRKCKPVRVFSRLPPGKPSSTWARTWWAGCA